MGPQTIKVYKGYTLSSDFRWDIDRSSSLSHHTDTTCSPLPSSPGLPSPSGGRHTRTSKMWPRTLDFGVRPVQVHAGTSSGARRSASSRLLPKKGVVRGLFRPPVGNASAGVSASVLYGNGPRRGATGPAPGGPYPPVLYGVSGRKCRYHSRWCPFGVSGGGTPRGVVNILR